MLPGVQGKKGVGSFKGIIIAAEELIIKSNEQSLNEQTKAVILLRQDKEIINGIFLNQHLIFSEAHKKNI